MHRVVGWSFRTRGAGALVAVAVGGLLLVVGATLLVGLLAVGAVVAAGVLLSRKLTGRGVALTGRAKRSHGLNPADEVFPDAQSERLRLDAPSDVTRRERMGR